MKEYLKKSKDRNVEKLSTSEASLKDNTSASTQKSTTFEHSLGEETTTRPIQIVSSEVNFKEDTSASNKKSSNAKYVPKKISSEESSQLNLFEDILKKSTTFEHSLGEETTTRPKELLSSEGIFKEDTSASNEKSNNSRSVSTEPSSEESSQLNLFEDIVNDISSVHSDEFSSLDASHNEKPEISDTSVVEKINEKKKQFSNAEENHEDEKSFEETFNRIIEREQASPFSVPLDMQMIRSYRSKHTERHVEEKNHDAIPAEGKIKEEDSTSVIQEKDDMEEDKENNPQSNTSTGLSDLSSHEHSDSDNTEDKDTANQIDEKQHPSTRAYNSEHNNMQESNSEQVNERSKKFREKSKSYELQQNTDVKKKDRRDMMAIRDTKFEER